jgi:hypothetical protein
VKPSLKIDQPGPDDPTWWKRHTRAEGEERLARGQRVRGPEMCQFGGAYLLKGNGGSAPLLQPFPFTARIGEHGLNYE